MCNIKTKNRLKHKNLPPLIHLLKTSSSSHYYFSAVERMRWYFKYFRLFRLQVKT